MHPAYFVQEGVKRNKIKNHHAAKVLAERLIKDA
jgi:hypothetical protein